jgi:O-antigen/teichoic acid export membrane protein
MIDLLLTVLLAWVGFFVLLGLLWGYYQLKAYRFERRQRPITGPEWRESLRRIHRR